MDEALVSQGTLRRTGRCQLAGESGTLPPMGREVILIPHEQDRTVAKSKLTSKGRVTIPKDVRERLGLRPGDEIEFVEDRSGFRVQKWVLASPLLEVPWLTEATGRPRLRRVGRLRLKRRRSMTSAVDTTLVLMPQRTPVRRPSALSPTR